MLINQVKLTRVVVAHPDQQYCLDLANRFFNARLPRSKYF